MKRLFQVMLLLSCCMLVGCGEASSKTKIEPLEESRMEKEIKREVKKSLKEAEEVVEVEILERFQEEPEFEQVHCRVESNDGKCVYTNYYVADFEYDSEGEEWELDKLSLDDEEEAEISLVNELTEEDIVDTLVKYSAFSGNLGEGVYRMEDGLWIESEEGVTWNLSYEKEGLKVTIEENDIDEESGKVYALTNVECTSGAMKTKGKLEFVYDYATQWNAESISVKEAFRDEFLPGCELIVTDDMIIEAVEGMELSYGKYMTSDTGVLQFYSTTYEQKFTIEKDYVTKTEIVDATYGGRWSLVKCEMILKKEHVSFNIAFELAYVYENDTWTLDENGYTESTLTCEFCEVYDLIGEWTGTYNGVPFDGTVVLDIQEMAADGTITAAYYYEPEESSSEEKGGYEVIGTINTETLLLELKAGEWLEKPAKPGVFEKQDVRAQIILNGSKLVGQGHDDNTFVVTK